MNVLNLFKYYSPKYGSNDNLSFYTQGELYFQQPIKFNDPWDCKSPPITISRQLNALRQLWVNLGDNNGHIFTDNEWNKLNKLSRSEIKKYFSTLYQSAFDNQRARIGVFSLSFIPDSELMWSHYAKSHTGYMLHFQINLEEYMNTAGIETTGIPIPVVYKNTRQTWNMVNYYKDREKHMYDLVRYKSKAWEYECELRLLNTSKHGFLKTPNNWLKSIVTGINTEDKFKNKLKSIGNELNIDVYTSIMSKDKYEILIPGLEINGSNGKNQYQYLLDSQILDLNTNK